MRLIVRAIRLVTTGAFLVWSLPVEGTAQGAADSAFMAAVEIANNGGVMRANVYVAAGPGPHQTVVVLKGFPGSNSPAVPLFLQFAGFNAVDVNFHGQLASDGLYTIGGTAADALAVIAFLRGDSARRVYRVDPGRVAIMATSAGSFAGLTATAEDPGIRCLALVVPFNWAIVGTAARTNAAMRSNLDAQAQQLAARVPPPVRLAPAFVATLVDSATSFDLRQAAARLSGRSVLMIGAQQDATAPIDSHFAPVVSALRRLPSATVRDTIVDDGHYLTATGNQLLGLVTRWLPDCQR